jgi:capsular polysaccharide transport system permease protein
MSQLTRHVNVLKALIIRDLMVRFGRHHLGFVWTILEPMILCSGVMILWSFIHASVLRGVPVVTFVLTGYMPLTLWRHTTNPMLRLLHGNVGLLYHQPLGHWHILLARTILEFLSATTALVVIYFVTTATGLVEPAEDPGLAMAAWLLGGWWFGSMGLTLGAFSEYWEPLEKFNQPIQYLLLPLSGVFFMVDWVPDYGQKALLLNPSVHFVEMFRAGFLGETVTTHYDVGYLVAMSAAMTLLGLIASYHVRDHIRLS